MGPHAGGHLEQHHAHRKQVGARVHRATGSLLWGHVARRADKRARRFVLPEGVDRQELRHPEVEHLHQDATVRLGGLDQHDVFGLEIAVDDPGVVQRANRLTDLPRDVDRVGHVQRVLALQLGAQRVAVDVLHRVRQASGRLLLDELHQVHQRLVLDHARGPRLVEEALHHPGPVELRRRQDLERHDRAVGAAARAEHRAGAALAEQLHQLVPTDPVADLRIRRDVLGLGDHPFVVQVPLRRRVRVRQGDGRPFQIDVVGLCRQTIEHRHVSTRSIPPIGKACSVPGSERIAGDLVGRFIAQNGRRNRRSCAAAAVGGTVIEQRLVRVLQDGRRHAVRRSPIETAICTAADRLVRRKPTSGH